MAIKYKFDVLEALKAKGYTTYRLRTEKLLSESTVQKLRNDEVVAIANVDTICRLLNCQPGDLLEHVDVGLTDWPEAMNQTESK